MDTYDTTAHPRAPTDVNTLLERLLNEAEQGGGTDAPPPTVSATDGNATANTSAGASAVPPMGGMGNISPLLGGLLSNPALLTAIPTILENLSPLLSNPSKPTGGTEGGSGGQAAAEGKTAIPTGGGGGGKHHSTDRHTALLCAIKPYLGAERQQAAETIIRLCRVWDAMERSGISLSGILSSVGGGATAPHGGEAQSVVTHEKEVT